MKNLLKSGKKQWKSSKEKGSQESSSTEQQTGDSELPKMVTKSSNDGPFSNVYRTPNELPLDKFMAIVVEDRFDLLLKEGEAPLDFLAETWADIYTWYAEKVDAGFVSSIQLNVEIEQLKAKIVIVNMAIGVLAEGYDEDVINILREHGFEFQFTKESLLSDLQKVGTLSKSWVSEYNLKIKERDGEDGEAGRGKKQSAKPTYDQFYETLEVLSKDAGYAIRPYDLTVYEYATRINRFFKRMQKQRQDEARKQRS